MKNFSQKTVSVLIWCTLIFLYAYSKTYKSNKKEVYDIKPKYVNSLKESDCYASEDDKDFAAGFKHGIIEKCKKLSKETPTFQNLKSLSPLSMRSKYSAALARVRSLGTSASRRFIIASPLARVVGEA